MKGQVNNRCQLYIMKMFDHLYLYIPNKKLKHDKVEFSMKCNAYQIKLDFIYLFCEIPM